MLSMFQGKGASNNSSNSLQYFFIKACGDVKNAFGVLGPSEWWNANNNEIVQRTDGISEPNDRCSRSRHHRTHHHRKSPSLPLILFRSTRTADPEQEEFDLSLCLCHTLSLHLRELIIPSARFAAMSSWLLCCSAFICQLLLLVLQLECVSSFPLPKRDSSSRTDSSYKSQDIFLLAQKPVTQVALSSSTTATTESDTESHNAIRLCETELARYFDFQLDDWQLEAGGFILLGYNVIVCAPTGSGKTVVGEMALHAAYNRGLDAIYTTPLKALSNQKFGDMRQIFGTTDVGLSTGDISINRQNARMTVMTTEVYRNIAWRSSSASDAEDLPSPDNNSDTNNRNDLRKNAVVVLDEFHYMGLPGRGGVWEECVITSPPHTQIIGLSATLPNAKELAEWMENVTGRPTKLIEAPGARPVPLKYLFATREGLFPLFKNPDAGPGAPLGLLGLRGDGVAPGYESKLNEKKTGFARDNDIEDNEKIPRGLQINPALKGIAQRRIQKVNRALERQKEQQRARFDNIGEEEWDLYGGRGGRGRGRQTGSQATQLSSREARREKERIMRKEMRKAVPSLPILLTRLKEKNLLPAIFFIFSRAGCDQAAETISNSFKGPRDPNIDIDFDEDFDNNQQKKKKKSRQRARQRQRGMVEDEQGRSFRLSSNYVDEDVFNSVMEADKLFRNDDDILSGSPLSSSNWKFFSSAGLLEYDQVRDVAGRVDQFNDENPEIAFSDDVAEQFLFGVGRHHAGMLPAHKMLVETLFRLNLMKVVFATETLAAGINMPARTTCLCSLAKRGSGGSMELLETSNLLQMAGRAGRRGMDIAGTCVLVATPFEGEEVAAKILTDPIKPISSQFRPSYALAVNLIARGQGKLEVAKQLVSRSFANWGKKQLENQISHASQNDGVSEVLVGIGEEKFMNTLVQILNKKVQQRSSKFDVAFLAYLVEILKDRELLKKSSKSFEAATLAFELEQTTLQCLKTEIKESDLDEETSELLDCQKEDQGELEQQIDDQQARVQSAEKKLIKHPFSSLVDIANSIMNEGSTDGRELLDALQSISGMASLSSVDGEDIARFAKSSVVVKRKLRKLARENPDVDPESLLKQTEEVKELDDSSWEDMLAITRTLVSCGCLVVTSGEPNVIYHGDLEQASFMVTPAGVDVGMLSFENSLWCFLAMGGTYDVTGASSGFDEMLGAMQDVFGDFFEGDESDTANAGNLSSSQYKAREEAETLISYLRQLSVGEMAGYVSCLVGETGRSSLDAVDVFRRVDPILQRCIQVLLESRDRFMDIQRQFSVDERTASCQFDLSNFEVVSAWANGCSWSEALEISGAAPGDLTRILSTLQM
jgi:superfamily II RNA helicase